MTARQDTQNLMAQFGRKGIFLSFDEVNTLRRAEIALRHWAEQECGDGNEWGSWAIERDEGTGIPYRVYYPNPGHGKQYPKRSTRVADKEAGALRRIKAICDTHKLHFYHQTDPRGCALYVSNEPLPESDYTRGVACCA